MFRFVVILIVLIAFPAFADYEVNLSVLDSLEPGINSEELPLPIIKTTHKRAKSHIVATKQPFDTETKTQTTTKADSQNKKLPDAASVSELSTKNDTIASAVETKSSNDTKQPNITYDFDSENNIVAEESTSNPQNENSQEEIIIHVPVEPLTTVLPQSTESVSSQNSTDNKSDEIALIPLDNFGTSRDTETSTLITFDDQSDRLTDDVVALLDEFVEKNKDNSNDKILIESYHYSGGENAFARKRISLNRAVNVRSYLLSKGYKSFGIQIINTEEEVTQNNVVISR